MTNFLSLREIYRSCICRCHHRRSPSRSRSNFACRRHRFRFGFCRNRLTGARALQKPQLPRPLSPSILLARRALHREPIPLRSLIRPHPPLRRLATRLLRLPYRLRTESPLGRTDEQPRPLALHRLLLIIVSGPARPLILHPHGALAPRRESDDRTPLSCRLACPDGTQSVRPRPRRACGNSSFNFRPTVVSRPSQRPTWMPSALLLNYSSGIPPCAIPTLTGRGNNRPSLRAAPPCVTSFLTGRRPYQPTSCRGGFATA